MVCNRMTRSFKQAPVQANAWKFKTVSANINICAWSAVGQPMLLNRLRHELMHGN